jgi:polysaccharide export outer membrane protein
MAQKAIAANDLKVSETSAASTAKTAARPDSPAGNMESYRVGIEDELQISVWREPEISSQVVVRPDGFISLPLLNDVKVDGLTTKELQTLITDKLRPFVTEPQVTVVVRQIRSRKVYLIGQVSKPGAYILNGEKTVLQLLAEAGGLSQFAKAKSIYIVRKVDGRETRLPFDYKKTIRASGSKADIQLQPGDMIVVP